MTATAIAIAHGLRIAPSPPKRAPSSCAITGPAPQARIKDDRSPVTDADEEAEAFILAALARDFPGVPVAAEEAAAAGA